MTQHVIPGVRRTSLSNQLAGLGLFRVLAEQADSRARCHFAGSSLAIDTTVDNLAEWLVDSYVPTPVLSPWNEGSGFGDKDKAPKDALSSLLAVESPRLDPLRRAFAIVSPLARAARDHGFSPGDKQDLIRELRSRCPDEMLPWLDAAVIALDNRLAFPPLLGSGGNDGRLDFSTNFHQRLLEVLPTRDRVRDVSQALAEDWLRGRGTVPVSRAAVGQFDPGSAGTPNSSPFGAGDSLVNPWVYVLMIEGSMVFAAKPARRLAAQASAQPRAAMPFMTFGSEHGMPTGSAAEESRGEVWFPWWTVPLSYASVQQLFADGRAVWRGRTAAQSSQMYLATAAHGIAPEISGLDRHALVKRNGLAFTAVLADEVRPATNAAVAIVREVEDWPDLVARQPDTTAAVRDAARAFEAGRVELVRAPSEAHRMRCVRTMLGAVTDLELAVARSGRTRTEIPPWAGRRDARALVRLLDHGVWRQIIDKPEPRIALGLASLVTGPLVDAPNGRCLREILVPIDPAPTTRERPAWRSSAIVTGYGQRDLVEVLADVITWLVTTARYAAPTGHPATVQRGVVLRRSGVPVPWQDVHLWATGRLADREVDTWLRAFLPLDWRNTRKQVPRGAVRPDTMVDPTLALVAPFGRGFDAGGDPPQVYGLHPDWITALRAGRPALARTAVVQRLRHLGRHATAGEPTELPTSGTRICAALLLRSSPRRPFEATSRPIRPDTPPTIEESS